MSYPAVEAAILDIVRRMDEFDESNSARGDPRSLAQGAQKHCHLRFGGFSIVRSGATNRISITYTVLADLWFRSRGEYKYYNEDVGNTVQAFIEQIYGYPTLGYMVNGATLVDMPSPSPAQQWQTDVQNWWIITLPINVTVSTLIPLLE